MINNEMAPFKLTKQSLFVRKIDMFRPRGRHCQAHNNLGKQKTDNSFV